MAFNGTTEVVAFPMAFWRASLAGQPRAVVPTRVFLRLAVCLKAYPDTNLSLSAASAELRSAWTGGGPRLSTSGMISCSLGRW
jgi:hypothetical protein